MLTITRERMYSGPIARGAKHVYKARVGSNDVASGETRETATSEAWNAIDGALRQQMAYTYVAITNDGCVMTAREYQPGFVEVQHNRQSGASVYRASGSEMSKLEIDGLRVDVRAYLANRLAMYNGSL
jgi:hypothetical protein